MKTTTEYYNLPEKAYVEMGNHTYQVNFDSVPQEENAPCCNCGVRCESCSSHRLICIHRDIIDLDTMAPITKVSCRSAIGKQVIEKLHSVLAKVYCDDCSDLRWSGEVDI